MRRMARVCAAAILLLPALRAGAEPVRFEKAETEHFLFVFEPRDRPAVDELLTYCEEVYAKVTSFFNSYPKKIPCVVEGRLDYANGSTTPFPMRLELITRAPYDDDTMGARSESWLKDLLTHELTHYVHLTMDRGLLRALSRVFGLDAAAATGVFIPDWMIEGPAVELETRFTEGGRGRNPFFEIYWKAPLLEDRLFSLEQAGYQSAFPPPGRVYVAGYFSIDDLLKGYGEDAFTRVMDDYLKFPFFGPWAALSKVTGKSASDLFVDLQNGWRLRYAEDAALPAGRLVTPDKIASGTNPQATALGLYLYESSPYRYPAIVSYDPQTRIEKELLRVELSDRFSFGATSDGKTVYFTTLSYDFARPALAEATSDLYVLDVASSRVRQVTNGSHLWQPAVSPDGTRLAAVQGSGPYSRLVEVDAPTGEMRVLFSRAEAGIFTPAISADGGRIAFVMNVRGMQDVYVMDLREAIDRSVPLTDPRAPVSDVNPELARPVWGPDRYGEYHPAFASDDRLLFSSDRSGSLCLYEADLESGTVSLVKRDPVAAFSGIESGGSLLYGSYTSRGFAVRETPVGGLSPEAVPNGQAEPYPPALEWTGRLVPSKPYVDFPLPYLWYPVPALAVTGPSGFEIGPGATVLAASLLSASSWSACVTYLPWSFQPQGSLAAGVSLGRLGIDASSDFSYGYAGDQSGGVYRQTVASQLEFSLPILSGSAFDHASALALNAGLSHSASLASESAFTFTDTLSGARQWQSFLDIVSGIGFATLSAGGAIDFFPPWELQASLGNTTEPPVLSATGWGSLFSLFLTGSIPSPLSHQVVKLGVKASYGVGSLQSASSSLIAPRGLFDPLPHSGPGALLASLEYLAPLGLLDLPLPLGWSLIGMGMGVHVEALADWDLATPAFQPLSSLFAGVELDFLFDFSSQTFPVSLGVSARIDTANPASFDVLKDLRPYLSLSFDSFRDAMADGPGGAARRGLLPPNVAAARD